MVVGHRIAQNVQVSITVKVKGQYICSETNQDVKHQNKVDKDVI